MNFYGLKSKLVFCLLPFISFSSHILTAIQEKAQPCQFFTLQKTTVVEHFDFTPTLYPMVSTF